MAVTEEFRAQWLECQDEYGKNIEDGDMPVIGIDEVDDTISLPAVRFTAPFNPSGENVFSGYAHVPMKTFKKKIDDLAGEVSEALSGLPDVQEVIEDANEAIADANAAAEAANNTNAAVQLAEYQRVQREQQREQQMAQAEQQREQTFATMQSENAAAVEVAQETAHHPSYADAEGWIYEYNLRTHAYDKTEKNMRGRNFTVDKVFSSVAEMTAYDGDKLVEGYFFMVNTGSTEDEDTAKLYIVQTVNGQLTPVFLVDMSGARGFTGHTPQFSIGTVTTGEPDSEAAASVSSDGTDEQGNPKYKLNLVIPKGDTFTWSDLTEENIAELQRPAREMADIIKQHPPIVGDNLNWWAYDIDAAEYRDTGKRAQQGVMFIDFDYDYESGDLLFTYEEVDNDALVPDMFSFADGDLIINPNVSINTNANV